MHSLKRT